MTNTQHTPGPWTAGGKTVWGGTGARLTICDTTCCGSMTAEEDKANARLIAEAPAMLDALRDSVRRWENKLEGDGFDPNPGPVWLQNYRAILAKIDD